MDSPLNSNGGGVSVHKNSSSFKNTFLWYFFQTLTVSSMLLIVLSIYWTFASGNIRVFCVITVAFAIITPSFIIPKLPRIAAVAIPIVELNQYTVIRVLNVVLWMYCGYVYPFPAHLLCYSLMAGTGLLKMYGGDIGGPSSLKFMSIIGGDAAGTSLYVFDHEKKYGTGRRVDSSTGWAMLGLFVVIMLAYYLPPLVKPEKKKKMMMNEIEAMLAEVVSEKKKVNVDHVVNVVAEAPIPGSEGTKVVSEKKEMDVDHVVNVVAEAPIPGSEGTKTGTEPGFYFSGGKVGQSYRRE